MLKNWYLIPINQRVGVFTVGIRVRFDTMSRKWTEEIEISL